jgi:hypothetical protein
LSAVFQLTDATAAMMRDMTGTRWGMGRVWLIVIVVFVLAIAALVKFFFFSSVIALEPRLTYFSR